MLMKSTALTIAWDSDILWKRSEKIQLDPMRYNFEVQPGVINLMIPS